jgi:Na+/H+-dicarboxylate symporter
MNDKVKKKKGISLSTQILLGLTLGLFVGLFLGDKASAFAIVGRAYIGLIQMSILPYMVVSLMLGIGSLSFEKAGKLAITGGIVLVASWFVAFIIVFLMPFTFPSIESGSFYSASLVEVAQVDFIDLYIPVNPFSSLARTVVPAAAVFSVAFGIALIGVEGKKSLLDILTAMSKALTRIAMMVVKITPIGVFAIAANAAGTMSIDEFGRLQSYIIPFVTAALLLTFWILPGLAATLTPFSKREILRSSRDALTTGFVTGNLFITLPMLVESIKKLFEEHRGKNEDTDNYIEVLVPTSFNFPNIGKLLTLLFVLFAGWFVGKTMTFSDYPGFAVLGLFTLFGGVDLALPFLLDQMQIPSDMYQLYVVTGVLNSWFATLLAVMNLFSFTLVAASATTGVVRVNWSSILRFTIISVGIFVAVILGTRFVLSEMVSKEDIQRRTLMQSEIKGSETADIKKTELEEKVVLRECLESIKKRGKLRVGYNPENLPFSFVNDNGDLVGFDIELMHILARELEIEPQFIPWTYDTVGKMIDQNQFDIAVGGLIVTPERLAVVNFSNPYLDLTTAVVVKDHRRHQFKSWRWIDKKLNIRFGVVGKGRAIGLQLYFPNSDIVLMKSYSEFFTGNPNNVDAIVISAEAGSAWTILYPAYSVVVPEPHIKAQAAFAMPLDDSDFEDFINDWLHMKKSHGIIDNLYKKWILGKKVEKKRQRWSIGRDVFGLWK